MEVIQVDTSAFRSRITEEDDDNRKENAVLCLERFAAVPWLRFGKVAVGSTATATVQFVNGMGTDVEAKPSPLKKGVPLSFDADAYQVPAGSQSCLSYVSWTPVAAGRFRESLEFKVKNLRFKVIAFGIAAERRREKVFLSILFFFFLLLFGCLIFFFLSSHSTFRELKPLGLQPNPQKF